MEPISVSINDAAKALGLGRTSIYQSTASAAARLRRRPEAWWTSCPSPLVRATFAPSAAPAAGSCPAVPAAPPWLL
jgi:hypothetical protein